MADTVIMNEVSLPGCPCGGRLSLGRSDLALPGFTGDAILHSIPMCAEFRKDRPADEYLAYVREWHARGGTPK